MCGGESGMREKLNGINPRKGKRNRCYFCDGEYHLLPCWHRWAQRCAGGGSFFASRERGLSTAILPLFLLRNRQFLPGNRMRSGR